MALRLVIMVQMFALFPSGMAKANEFEEIVARVLDEGLSVEERHRAVGELEMYQLLDPGDPSILDVFVELAGRVAFPPSDRRSELIAADAEVLRAFEVFDFSPVTISRGSGRLLREFFNADLSEDFREGPASLVGQSAFLQMVAVLKSLVASDAFGAQEQAYLLEEVMEYCERALAGARLANAVELAFVLGASGEWSLTRLRPTLELNINEYSSEATRREVAEGIIRALDALIFLRRQGVETSSLNPQLAAQYFSLVNPMGEAVSPVDGEMLTSKKAAMIDGIVAALGMEFRQSAPSPFGRGHSAFDAYGMQHLLKQSMSGFFIRRELWQLIQEAHSKLSAGGDLSQEGYRERFESLGVADGFIAALTRLNVLPRQTPAGCPGRFSGRTGIDLTRKSIGN